MENPWDKISKLVTSGTYKDLKGIKCPVCNNSLQIGFCKSNRGAGSIGIKCNQHHRFWLDGVAAIPPWVNEVGDEFKT